MEMGTMIADRIAEVIGYIALYGGASAFWCQVAWKNGKELRDDRSARVTPGGE
jgi:hypothetical protein